MNIALYFGSFNPIHIAHLKVASYVASLSEIDQLWFVVSPQNPHKDSATLAPETDRLKMVSSAVVAMGLDEKVKVCDIEFSLSKPSFTYQTLLALRQNYPSYRFSILVGADNISQLHRWKNSRDIIESTHIYVYPRSGYSSEPVGLDPSKITLLCSAELMDVSSTNIRQSGVDGKDILEVTKQYIDTHGLYSLDNRATK